MHGDDITYITTFTGKKFWCLDPRPEDVDIEDIAHHLSNLGRWTGATRHYYSVAEHSVRVSYSVDQNLGKEILLQGLLHDASEAYLNDISSPVKHSNEYSEYRNAENRVWKAIASAFNLPEILHSSIHQADLIMLVTERRDLVQVLRDKWLIKAIPLANKIYPLSPEIAKEWFLDRFNELKYK